MSVCIEQNNFRIKYRIKYQNNHNNFSQHLPVVSKVSKLPRTRIPKNSFLAQFKIWNARYKQRKQLALLDNERLQDIGITPAEAKAEYSKPFWK